jgi:hypothetical protein
MVMQSLRYRQFVAAALHAMVPTPPRSVGRIRAPYRTEVKTAASDASQ